MADMNEAIQLTIKNEGGFVDNPADKGGATNMGIEQRDIPNIPIQSLTVEQAVEYYKEHYVKPWMFEINSQVVLNKLFDMGVLLGVQTAVRLLQRALKFPVVHQDGDFGPETLSATNGAGDGILFGYKSILTAHFIWITKQDTTQEPFLAGWLTRVNS